jgi:hypothetical protein
MICSTTVRRAVAVAGTAGLLAAPALSTPSDAAGTQPDSRVVRSSHQLPWHPNAAVRVVRTAGTRTYLAATSPVWCGPPPGRRSPGCASQR